MTLVGGVGDRAVPWPRLTTREDVGGAGCGGQQMRSKVSTYTPTCVLTRFLPRALSASVGVEVEGSVAGTGSVSVAFDGPGSLMYGAVCS